MPTAPARVVVRLERDGRVAIVVDAVTFEDAQTLANAVNDGSGSRGGASKPSRAQGSEGVGLPVAVEAGEVPNGPAFALRRKTDAPDTALTITCVSPIDEDARVGYFKELSRRAESCMQQNKSVVDAAFTKPVVVQRYHVSVFQDTSIVKGNGWAATLRSKWQGDGLAASIATINTLRHFALVAYTCEVFVAYKDGNGDKKRARFSLPKNKRPYRHTELASSMVLRFGRDSPDKIVAVHFVVRHASKGYLHGKLSSLGVYEHSTAMTHVTLATLARRKNADFTAETMDAIIATMRAVQAGIGRDPRQTTTVFTILELTATVPTDGATERVVLASAP
jgi:hypothetical protein